ncbi:sugar ABC transporter ATP-binding protein [Aminobacterium mobile]|jgi:simple sugar transport system ATP-binding protein|uniref:sugar ABC transporter ATP-binding protein n=1 Tax=Aminobacterium mobile TaxID=81467 RepID=UPI002FD9AD8B
MFDSKPLLQMCSICKDFYGNKVLEGIDFHLKRGEIIGLVGENGAGKSTLMNVLFGMPVIHDTGGYSGKILIEGEEVHFTNPLDAIDNGIGMVHQEFFLIPSFTATENILLNREVSRYNPLVEVFGDRFRLLDRPAMKKRAEKAIQVLGVDIHPDALVSEMPVSYKQFTEIAREIDREQMKILVLDEPTAVLTESEAETFLKTLKRLSAKGIGLIFISHRLQEVLDVCDRIIVLRDGRVIRDIPTSEADNRSIASWMVGREIKESSTQVNKREKTKRPVVLSVQNLQVDMPGEKVKNVSFDAFGGEILGIGGLAGQGKLGIPNGIMGLFPSRGTVLLDGKELKLNDPLSSLRSGLSFISEDRRGVGLLLDESIALNIAFTAMQVHERFIKKLLGGFIKWRNEEELYQYAEDYIKKLDIKCTGPNQRVIELSGGNQQKVCVAKVLATSPHVLFASEPTRGIDIGAKQLVLDVLKEFNEKLGTTIIVTSSELQELRSVCHRIAIVSEGEIADILPADAPLEEFGLLMLGNKKKEEATHA